jgi:hypothetical protein
VPNFRAVPGADQIGPRLGRAGASGQIAGLRMAYERRQTFPLRMTITVVVRASNRAILERSTKRLPRRSRLGTVARLLAGRQD